MNTYNSSDLEVIEFDDKPIQELNSVSCSKSFQICCINIIEILLTPLDYCYMCGKYCKRNDVENPLLDLS